MTLSYTPQEALQELQITFPDNYMQHIAQACVILNNLLLDNCNVYQAYQNYILADSTTAAQSITMFVAVDFYLMQKRLENAEIDKQIKLKQNELEKHETQLRLLQKKETAANSTEVSQLKQKCTLLQNQVNQLTKTLTVIKPVNFYTSTNS